jgi:cell division protein FtsB
MEKYIKIFYYLILMTTEDLLQEIALLKEENAKLKSQLENYNNSRKSYYEKNKDAVNEKAKERLKKIAEENPDKIKEYARRAYLKRKEKLKQKESENI